MEACFRLLNCRSWCCCSYSWSPLGHVGLAVLQQPRSTQIRASLKPGASWPSPPWPLPDRAAIRRKNEPRGVALARSQRVLAASRNARAARLGPALTLDDSTLPADCLTWGHRPSHEQNCLLLGHLLMSVPISPSSTNAVVSSIPSIAVRSTFVTRYTSCRIETRAVGLAFPPATCRRLAGVWILQRLEVRLICSSQTLICRW